MLSSRGLGGGSCVGLATSQGDFTYARPPCPAVRLSGCPAVSATCWLKTICCLSLFSLANLASAWDFRTSDVALGVWEGWVLVTPLLKELQSEIMVKLWQGMTKRRKPTAQKDTTQPSHTSESNIIYKVWPSICIIMIYCVILKSCSMLIMRAI